MSLCQDSGNVLIQSMRDLILDSPSLVANTDKEDTGRKDSSRSEACRILSLMFMAR